jgi:4-aminobutyrate aminotransferase-like enzyme
MKNQIPSKQSLLELRKKHFLPTAGLYHPTEPLYLVRAEGEYVYDEAGRRYLDAIGGIVCISAGHHHPEIKRKLMAMLEANEIQHTSLLYLNHHVVELAETVAEEAPEGLDRVSFTNSGSEANELAFMAVRNATGESIIIHLQHSYHGGTASTLSHCGHHTWRYPAQPVSGAVTVPAPYCYRCPFGQTAGGCNLECAKAVEESIKTATHGRIAGMIVEPVLGVGGYITPSQEYFAEVTRVVHEYGGKYISDEVQTGSGRCGGALFLTKDLGIDADVITTAKGFGNGAAIGAVVMTSEIAEKMAGKFYFNTFGGDPYQTAQAQATIDVIRKEKLIENAGIQGKRLMDGLLELQKRHTLIGDIRGRGLLIGVELVRDRKTKEFASTEAVAFMDLCRNKGLLLGKGGLHGNVIRVAPPLTVSSKQIDELLAIMDQVFAELGN